MTATQVDDNKAALRIMIFCGFLVLGWAWLSLGLPAFLAGLGLIAILWATGAGGVAIIITCAALIGLSAWLHHIESWPFEWLLKTPSDMARVAFRDFDATLQWWLNAWSNEGAIPAWQLVHGAIYGNAIMVVGFLFSLSDPVKRKYRADKRAEKQAKKRQKQKHKPILGNPDKQAADYGEASLMGVTLQGGNKVYLTDKHLNTHLLVGGTTGSGKTVSVLNIVESFINRGFPVLYVDGKGDFSLGKTIVDYAAENGVASRYFAMDPAAPCDTYNPMAYGSFTSKKDRLIELREWSEPHYRKLAEGYLQMVFKVLDSCGVSSNLLDVASYMSRDALGRVVREAVAEQTIAEDLGKSLMEEIAEQSAAEKHIEGIAAEIRNLARSEFGHLFKGEDSLVIGDAMRRGEVIYMGLLPVKYPALAQLLGRLIVNDFKATLDPSNPMPMLVVFDEFGVFAGDQVLNIINQGRSAGVHAVLTVQSLSDIGRNIDKNAEMFIEQVISNCNNFLIHRANSKKNAEELANIIGTRLAQQLTYQLGETGATGMGSARSTREFIIHPDKITTLPNGQAVFLNRNDSTVYELNARFGAIAKRG